MRLLLLAPWRRGPLLLLRRPGVFVDLPLVEVIGTTVAVFAIAVAATLFAQARTGRAAPSEVLRDAN